MSNPEKLLYEIGKRLENDALPLHGGVNTVRAQKRFRASAIAQKRPPQIDERHMAYRLDELEQDVPAGKEWIG